MCGQSLGKVGQGVLELLIGKEKVTDGWTYLPMILKWKIYQLQQLCLLFGTGTKYYQWVYITVINMKNDVCFKQLSSKK